MSAEPGQQELDQTPMGDRPIGVVLVNHLPGALAQMMDLLTGEPDMAVFVNAESADEALYAMRGLPHRLGVVVVVTLGLGGDHDSFWLIRTIREMYPTLHVLACGTDIDDATISWALFTGADGFVALEVDPGRFVQALRRIARRELILEGLPSGWMAREDDRVAPLIVLPEPAGEPPPPDVAAAPTDDATVVLPEEGPSEEPEGIVVARGTERSRHPLPGSRIGRLFARRRRGQGPLLDPEDLD